MRRNRLRFVVIIFILWLCHTKRRHMKVLGISGPEGCGVRVGDNLLLWLVLSLPEAELA